MSEERIEIEEGSGNVFEDLGLPNAEEELAKAQLGTIIREAIRSRGLTQAQAAALMGETQPNVSLIVGGKLSRFSLERLMRLTAALGKDIRLMVTDAPVGKDRGQLIVNAS